MVAEEEGFQLENGTFPVPPPVEFCFGAAKSAEVKFEEEVEEEGVDEVEEEEAEGCVCFQMAFDSPIFIFPPNSQTDKFERTKYVRL